MGYMMFLGFAIPFAIAFPQTPQRDAQPSPGRCCLCKRVAEETWALGNGDRVCVNDVADIVRRSGARRVLAPRRSIDPLPVEIVASPPTIELDPWWDRQVQ